MCTYTHRLMPLCARVETGPEKSIIGWMMTAIRNTLGFKVARNNVILTGLDNP